MLVLFVKRWEENPGACVLARLNNLRSGFALRLSVGQFFGTANDICYFTAEPKNTPGLVLSQLLRIVVPNQTWKLGCQRRR